MPLSASIQSRLRHQHETIGELIGKLSELQLRRRIDLAKWSAFENIAHLACYQPVFLQRIRRMQEENKHLTPEQARKRNLPVMLMQGGIHAGEIDGKDAGFLAVREFLENTAAPGATAAKSSLGQPGVPGSVARATRIVGFSSSDEPGRDRFFGAAAAGQHPLGDQGAVHRAAGLAREIVGHAVTVRDQAEAAGERVETVAVRVGAATQAEGGELILSQ